MIALVTGAGSGLGKALADELERTGWTVARSDLQPGFPPPGGRQGGSELPRGERPLIPLDVRDAAAFKKVIDDLYQQHGRLDLLVNNAGVAGVGQAHELEAEDWSHVLDINLHGSINGIQAAYPRLVAQRSGAILNVSSLAGLLGFPGCLPYAASKWAMVGITLSLRTEARRHGVKVCAFCPGFLKTSIFTNARYRGIDGDQLEKKLLLPMMPVEAGARAALAGLRKNQGLITYPFYASLLTLPMRLNLAFAELFHRPSYSHLLRHRLGAPPKG